jgi:hypothetical protein
MATMFRRAGTIARVSLLTVAFLFMAGCKNDDPQAQTLQTRLTAARQIESVTERDEALQDLALTAARAGNGPLTEKAIGYIDSTTARDHAAAESAIVLAEAGKMDAAEELAKAIESTAFRDETLAQLVTAKGNWAAGASSTEKYLRGRLAAAQGIRTDDQRDAALKAIALDATGSGMPQVAVEAVRSIGTVSVRDDAARQAALQLAEAGRPEDADRLAAMIMSDSLRDKTLAEIASR